MTAVIRMEQLQALVLNADWRPLEVMGWRDAIEMRARGIAMPLVEHEAVVRSPSVTWRVPCVLVWRRFVSLSRLAAYTRRNVFLAYVRLDCARPYWNCALCGGVMEASEQLTFDHVVPRSAGGTSTWDNLALAHPECNSKKGSQTLPRARMRLHVPLVSPTEQDLVPARLRWAIRKPDAAWADYLAEGYWDVPLDR